MTADKNEKKRFVIIDGNAIIHRAYHALPPLTAKDGTMVNAVFGFTSMILRVMNELKPAYIAVSFDVAGPTFRDKIYDKYKATRVKADQSLYDQIPLCYEVVKAFGIPIYIKEGFEADDVIGTIVQRIRNKELGIRNGIDEVIIVTGDMDMVQLVDNDFVKIYELRRGLSDVVLFNADSAKEKFGFDPKYLVDYKALRGDVSDNIPGVHGIGEKTAVQLITKIGGVDEIYENMRNTKNTKLRNLFTASVIKKLEAGEADARMSKELATIQREILDFRFEILDCVFDVTKLEQEMIKKLFAKFGFFSLLKRVPGVDHENMKTLKHENSEAKNKPTAKRGKFSVVTEDTVAAFLKEITKTKVFACKEMLDGTDVLTARLTGMVFVCAAEAFYLDWNKIQSKVEVLRLFGDEDKVLVRHDVKPLLKAIAVETSPPSGGLVSTSGVRNRLFDIMIASYIINSSTRAHDLRAITLRELGEDLPAGSEQESLFGPDPKMIARELEIVLRLYGKYDKDLSAVDRKLFNEMEMKLIPVLADMELSGVAVDKQALALMSKDVAIAIGRATKKICDLAGEEFNVASSAQLRDILFEKLKLSVAGVKKGKTGYSTAAPELEKLRGTHPIIELIEEHRELAKLQNTYVDVLPTLINKKTGRIHTTFNQTVATTGRLSSSEPNLQNIPIRTELGREVRNAFVAEDGFVLLSADYSQIELRIAAHLADDPTLIKIFKNGEDVHVATAAAIYDIPLDKVTPEQRFSAKAINFGILYGMGTYGLAWRTGMSSEEARVFIDTYFARFAKVKKWIDETIVFARDKGYVETIFGRRRYIPELQTNNYQVRAAGERMAVNMPIQGTSADITKLAMIKTHEHLSTRTLEHKDVRMILQVHDELVFEVKKGLEREVGEMMKKIMEEVVKLKVPVVVEVGYGARWGEVKSKI